MQYRTQELLNTDFGSIAGSLGRLAATSECVASSYKDR